MPIRTHHFRLKIKTLRREATRAETLLWDRLRDRQLSGFKFRRQQPILGYIVDFCCLRARLIVEVDGDYHEDQTRVDEARSAKLVQEGFRVLRFSNYEVDREIDKVLREIEFALKPSPLSPLPGRERGNP